MSDSFQDDPAWVRFRCLELAKDITKTRSVEVAIQHAQKIHRYITPASKHKIIKLRHRK